MFVFVLKDFQLQLSSEVCLERYNQALKQHQDFWDENTLVIYKKKKICCIYLTSVAHKIQATYDYVWSASALIVPCLVQLVKENFVEGS